MKLKLIIFPICLMAMNAFGFQGSVRQVVKNYNGTGTTMTLTWYIGADKCRVDMAASGKDVHSNTVLILDPAAQSLKTYEASGTGEKLYYQVNASDISGSLTIISVNATQETRQINGYKCEKWSVATAAGAYNIWVARDIDFDCSAYREFFKTSIEIQALAFQGVKGFPMLTESANGANASSVESVSTQAPAADVFNVPGEYKMYSSAPAKGK